MNSITKTLVLAVGFVVDGAEVRVVSGGSDGHLRYWKLDPMKLDPMMEVVDLALPNIPYDLDVSDDGGMYIVATGEGAGKGTQAQTRSGYGMLLVYR